MKELEIIAAEVRRAREAGKPAALATVVSIEGSAYRLPGARMLIVDGKWIAGSISGGCLEDDVVLRAGEAIARNEPLVTTYDTTSDDDIVFGVGLGCKGIITIFIEPVSPSQRAVDFVSFAGESLRNRQAGTVATVIRTHGGLDVKAGARLLMRDDAVEEDIGNAGLVEHLKRDLASASPGAAGVETVNTGGGSAEVFIERIEPPTPLVVFGAGHDAAPVVRLAKEIGWHVILVDHRPAYANASRFPLADRIVLCQPAAVPREIALDGDTLTLVMTHNYLRDRDLLEILLPSAVRYIGLLGPRKRTDQLLADLDEKGARYSGPQLDRLYAPVGLDIGSEGPSEVAMSILAEMHAVLTGHVGRHLRERKRPIHQRENAGAAA
jgi:xanthine/CO dehydrogenase XdhC/CoxF family maturation factor